MSELRLLNLIGLSCDVLRRRGLWTVSRRDEGVFMTYERQWLVDLLRRLGYTQAADDAARLPDQISQEQLQKFGDQHGISRDEIIDRMGGSP
jgi:hypothetical protein